MRFATCRDGVSHALALALAASRAAGCGGFWLEGVLYTTRLAGDSVYPPEPVILSIKDSDEGAGQ